MIFKLFFICSLFLGQLFSAPILDDDDLFESTFTYIVNGTDAKIEDFPWQASIYFDGRHNCGSSLINSYWAITAAHCFKSEFNSTKRNRFFSGSDNLKTYYRNLDLGYEIEKIYTHPQFRRGGVNDIALIKLKQPVKINNKTIKPICLINENNKPRAYETLIATGFGSTMELDYKGILKKSQYLEDASFDSDETMNDLSRIYIKKIGGSSICHGDSGSPLHYITKTLEKYLVGIVSTGDFACRGPANYTRISYHLDYIKKTVDKPFCIKNLNEL